MIKTKSYPLAGAFLCLLFVLTNTRAIASGHADTSSSASKTGWEAFAELQKGNTRFVSGSPQHPHQENARRDELSKGQTPPAMVLSCSDSRVAPELVFDQGLGDVFTVRVAGNVASSEAIASIEYAIEHLGSKLLVVMGHTSCGAVKAALTTPKSKSAGSENLDKLVSQIRPGILPFLTQPEKTIAEDSTLKGPVKSNVLGVVKDLLKRSTIINQAVKSERIVVAQGLYDLGTGKVDFWDVGEKFTYVNPVVLKGASKSKKSATADVAPAAATTEHAH